VDEAAAITDPAPRAATRLRRVPEVADMLAVSERYVWQLIADGELRKVTQGKAVAVRDDDLAAYIDAHTIAS
jgi:excisionase family DNA binding protein